MLKKNILLLMSVIGLWGNAQKNITGKVVDIDNNAIAFANVVAKLKTDSTLVKGAISDDEGSFNLLMKEPETCFLMISYVGFKTKTIASIISDDLGTIVLDEAAEQLNEVAVVVQKPFIQREQDKLVVNVENSIVSAGSNTLEVLGRSPGIIINQDDNISLSGRSGVRIYIDNKDTRLQGEQLANLLRSLPSSNIEKIEIISNPSVRYEAQGNAGIINIVTKKGKLYGTNGSLTLSPGQGKYFRWNNSVDFNHRTENFNIFGQYSFSDMNRYQEIVIDRVFLQGDDPISYYNLQNDFELPISNHNGRLGIDYNPNERTTIGLLFSGLRSQQKNISTSHVFGFDIERTSISEELTTTNIKSNWNQFTTNFNAGHRFKDKSSIDLNLDYARYTNGSDQNFVSDFEFFDTGDTAQDILLGDVDGFLNLAGITLDYRLPLKNGNVFETGWKNTWVTADNDLKYVNDQNGTIVPNENLSNHFIYDEAIYAAYASYSINKKKWNAQLGLRAENTFIKGNQVITDNVFKNDYFNLFPTASYNYTLNEKHALGISLGRRIDRPSYGQLNPFRTFVNTNTFREGNPFLQPQFTWVSELNYTFKRRYYVALNVGYTTDNLNNAIIRNGDEEVVVVKPINIDKLKSYSLVASFPVRFWNWWESNWNINASVSDFDGEINGFNFDRNNPVVSLNTNHNFNLGKGYRLQVNAFYLFPNYATVTKIETISAVSLGFQKNILKDKATLRFNFNDIFWNQYPTGRTRFGSLDDTFTSYRDTRFATLSFTWRFGKQTVQPQRRRQSEIQNELNRARQTNNNG
ncbi:outer membrane receptor protein involved in Fe transport [Aquimarina sp. MAR_2010_214]|uniref:outer membrane beta-barrel family protein n=1 Tax=Aquimarina sp. MAR_2010_214 TaxID=1250026 RepID=UPI000C714096|nr:outer membrane beta-barrel family protein [Aquimarina sp. MAR_2010_214]PKV49084.1 outer membrane receptor protein involved in Fe transport [Aquimarina sp. MAR_2010_214]